MFRRRTILLLLTIPILTGCLSHKVSYSLHLIQAIVLDSIPSGSGMVVKNDRTYVIGDDATGLYQLDVNNLQHKKLPLAGLKSSDYRIDKSLKHDFESASFFNSKGRQYIIAFGSGSYGLARDSFLLYNISDEKDHRMHSLHLFYKHLQQKYAIDSLHWNIEGATITGDELFLFNRGTNGVIQMKVNDFIHYVEGVNLPFPATGMHVIKLPSIQGHEARLSGACTLDNKQILFSASVEDTPDWTSDGPVLGSYIGIYSISKKRVVSAFLLKNEKDQPLKQKIESLDILEKQKSGEILLLAIADNDDGSSVLFKLRLDRN